MKLGEFIDDYSYTNLSSSELARFALDCEDSRIRKLADKYLTSRFAFLDFIAQNNYKWR